MAEIYGYETKNFKRQVKNNIAKFEGDDFMFELNDEEVENLSRCKNFTLNMGRGSNIKYKPYVFTEQGVYMLMTVLRGELAIKQSRALVKTFKKIIDEVEETMTELKSQIYELKKNQIDADSIYGFLGAFNEVYSECTDAEKKQFMQAFIERIDIFPERREDGNWIQNIKFQFPVPIIKEDKEVEQIKGISLDKEKSDEHMISLEKLSTLETVVLLSHKKPDGHINVKVEFGEGEGKVPLDNIAKRAEEYKPKERVTYKMIKEYIEAKYGFKVHTAYIAEVKRDLGLPMYDAPNAVEELKQPRKHPTAEKVEAIKDALKHFEVI